MNNIITRLLDFRTPLSWQIVLVAGFILRQLDWLGAGR